MLLVLPYFNWNGNRNDQLKLAAFTAAAASAAALILWHRQSLTVKKAATLAHTSSESEQDNSEAADVLPPLSASGRTRRSSPAAGNSPPDSPSSASGAASSWRKQRKQRAQQLKESPGTAPSLTQWQEVLAPRGIQFSRRPDGSFQLLGMGTFGRVYKGTKDGKTPVVLKVFLTAGQPLNDARDMEVLRSKPNPHIVQMLDCCSVDGHALLVMEYMEGGTLWRALHSRPHAHELLWGSRERPGLGRQIALDVARGLHFLHSHCMTHQDLRPRNVFLGENGTAKLGDVVRIASTALNLSCRSEILMQGLPPWLAPEVVRGEELTEKINIYTFGVILWELCTSEIPLGRSLRPVRVSEECPEAVAELIDACMDENPLHRPGATDVVQILEQLGQEDSDTSPVRLWRRRSGGSSTVDTAAEPAPTAPDFLRALIRYIHVCKGPTCAFSYDDARELDLHQLLPLFGGINDEFLELAADPDIEDPRSRAHGRLVEVLDALRALAQALRKHAWRYMRRMQAKFYMEDAPPEKQAELAQAQRRALAEMRLTPEQRASWGAAYHHFICNQLPAIAERRNELLTAATAAETSWEADGMVPLYDMAEQLQALLREEDNVLRQFWAVTWFSGHEHRRDGGLTHLQELRGRVAAWPSVPNPIMIGSFCAEELGAKAA